jgi:hypothetical protein
MTARTVNAAEKEPAPRWVVEGSLARQGTVLPSFGDVKGPFLGVVAEREFGPALFSAGPRGRGTGSRAGVSGARGVGIFLPRSSLFCDFSEGLVILVGKATKFSIEDLGQFAHRATGKSDLKGSQAGLVRYSTISGGGVSSRQRAASRRGMATASPGRPTGERERSILTWWL